MISLGYEFLLEGDLERATELNEEAVALFRKQGRRGDLQYALDNLGWSALLQGDHQRAEALYEESLVLCRDLGDKLVASESLEGLACSAGARGEASGRQAIRGRGGSARSDGLPASAQRPLSTEPYLAAAHAQVDEATWSAAWEKGRSMEFEDAVVYALEDPNG